MDKHKQLQKSSISFFLALVTISLSGCTPEKAKALRVGAVQFKSESLGCIVAIDTMRQKELEAPARTAEEAHNDFVNNILGLNDVHDEAIEEDDDLSIEEEIELARYPNAFHLDPGVEEKWATFVSDMNNQYSSFAAIYENLEQGSFLAAEPVENSAEYADKLTLQMAAFANSIEKAPPELIQYRADIAFQLIELKQEVADGASDENLEQIKTKAGELLDRLEKVELQEQELRDTTVSQCLKAAVLGQELRPLIDSYDQLNLDDINLIISGILDTVGSINGLDYSALKQKTTALIVKLQEDEVLKPFAEKILTEVGEAVGSRNPTRTSQVSSYLIDDQKIAADLKSIVNGINLVTIEDSQSVTITRFPLISKEKSQ
jgi:hypothetical protein